MDSGYRNAKSCMTGLTAASGDTGLPYCNHKSTNALLPAIPYSNIPLVCCCDNVYANGHASQGLLNKLVAALTLRAAEVKDDVDHGVGSRGMQKLVPDPEMLLAWVMIDCMPPAAKAVKLHWLFFLAVSEKQSTA
eukprot:6522169-Pyramimonas_sp.AAC.1